MAFVYTEARWSPNKNQQIIPGPGSYIVEVQKESESESKKNRKKLFRGTAFPKTKQTAKIDETNIQFGIKAFQKNQLLSRKQSSGSSEIYKRYCQTKQSLQGQNNEKQKSLTIKSLSYKQLNKLKRNSNKQNKIISMIQQQTSPSIKNLTRQNFYIGPQYISHPQQIIHQNRQNNKNLSHTEKNKLRTPLRSQFQNKWMPRQEAENKILGQVFHELKSSSNKKPLSACHPFRKKQLLRKQRDSCQKIESKTGIQDDESEFQLESTPGPGSYNIETKPSTTKKMMMFTQYQDRFAKTYKIAENNFQFQEHKVKNKIPHHSRAPQLKVGFGKSIKSNKTKQMIDDRYRFYDDNQTICDKGLVYKINNNMKTLIPADSHLNFASKEKLREKQFMKYEDEIMKLQQNMEKNKYTSQFKMKTANKESHDTGVKFTGQQYKTISYDLEKNIQNSAQKPAFQSSKQRFQNKKASPPKIRTQLQVKHGLIEDINGFRQRPSKQSRRQIKAYTFQKNQKNNIEFEDEYFDFSATEEKNLWIKKTFNTKFKQV